MGGARPSRMILVVCLVVKDTSQYLNPYQFMTPFQWVATSFTPCHSVKTMGFSWTGWNIALLSGLIGAVIAQLLSALFQRRLEVRRTKLDVLRKIAGSRAAVTDK